MPTIQLFHKEIINTSGEQFTILSTEEKESLRKSKKSNNLDL
ncbi:hypothetical protein EU94_0877 [Prochlorococcus marinus str. MIT 9123]|nr:hypothetical protein EU94_0877 [Prochlorococcus marinus str. MIT 9123]